MSWLAFPLSILFFFVGVALCFHGFSFVVINKHYHGIKEEELT